MYEPSKRVGINNNFPFDPGMIIDLCRAGGLGPTSVSGNPIWNKDVLDAITGLPNVASMRTVDFTFGATVPASSDFAGPYVIWWTGNARWDFLNNSRWTIDDGQSSNYVQDTTGRWHGTNSRLVVNYNGPGGSESVRILDIDLNSTNDYPTEFHWYRLEDEADFLAGLWFRRPHMQHYVDANFSYIRHMNWLYVNASQHIRYRNRNKPEQQTISGKNFLAGDTYGEITGTNQYAIADSTGSPAAMEHGEVVQARVTNGMVRSGVKTVTAITKGANGRVTATAHGYNTGDIVKHNISAGMVELNNIPCTITVIDVDTYDTNVNTTAFTNFSAGTVNQYITLNRGGHGDYPVVFINGTVPASNYGNSYIAANDYKYFVFHKGLVASTLVTGAWIFSNAGNISHNLGVPAELIAKFHKELDDMQIAQSTASRQLGPTSCYVNIPGMGLCSMDADYDEDDAFGIQMVNTLTNGNGSWPAVPARCRIVVADDNESWNFGGDTFGQTYLKARLGFLRYGGGTADGGTYHALHSCVLGSDLRTAFPAEFASGRVIFVMEGQGTLGITGLNATRINGHATLDADALFISLGGGDPIDYHDGFAWASYFLAGPTYDTANLTTLAATYAAATTDVEREAACKSYVDDGVVGSGYSESVGSYRNTKLPEYADAMQAKSKIALQYEGGWDKTVTGGTAEVNTFLVAVKRSRAWARALQYNYRGWVTQDANPDVTTNAYYPADYIMIDARFGHIPATEYFVGDEGSGLDAAFLLMGKNNCGTYSFEGSA